MVEHRRGLQAEQGTGYAGKYRVKHRVTPKGVKHVVMARGRWLFLFSTITVAYCPNDGYMGQSALWNEKGTKHMTESPGLGPISGLAFSFDLQSKRGLKPPVLSLTTSLFGALW